MPYLLQVVSRGADGVREERWQPNSLYITVDRKREILGKGHRQTDGHKYLERQTIKYNRVTRRKEVSSSRKGEF